MKLKKQVYIVSHVKDQQIAQSLAAQLADAGILCRISCNQSVQQIGASVVNCDAAVVIVSRNTETPESVENIVSMLLGKTIIRYVTDDTPLSTKMLYFLSNTPVIKDGKDDAVRSIQKLLDAVEVKKDMLIIADEGKEPAAEILSESLAYKGISSIVLPYDSGLEEQVRGCHIVIAVSDDKKSDAYQKAKEEGKRRKTRMLFCKGQQDNGDKGIQRFTAKTLRIIDKVKPPSKAILTENTAKVKSMKKPVGRILSALIFAQVFVSLLWLTSKYNVFLGGALLAAVAGYILLLWFYMVRCAYKGCKNKHNGKKAQVIIIGSKKSSIQRFCGAHDTLTDVSAEKNTYRLMTAAAAVVTAVFAVFLVAADVQASDFTFLDLRERIASQRQAVFADAGFEAFVRKSFDLGDGPISCGTLSEIDALIFDEENMTQPIESLEDLAYFPNLLVFSTMEVEEIAGDFSSFTYTPKLQHLLINSSGITGDIGALNGLTELETLDRGFRDHREDLIYGDIAVFENMPYLRSLNFPDTSVSGNIAALSNLDLEHLTLAYTDVYGDISSLEGMGNLMDLLIFNVNITGDIVSLENCNSLSVIEMNDANVTGDISVLSDLTLNSLCLGGTDVYGDIAVLRNMTSLEYLELHSSAVSGDISVLADMHDLFGLTLGATEITGDVAVFENMPKLECLWLGETNVYGDASVFSSLENLLDLEYGDTNVAAPVSDGDINADPMNVASTVLINPTKRHYEGAKMLERTAGGMFGDIDVKQLSADGSCFQFISQENDAWMPHSIKLLPENNVNYCGNAFMIKFQPEQVDNLVFHFVGEDSIAVSFGDDDRPCFVNEQSGEVYPFFDYAPSNLSLQPDKWYYALFAFEADGRFRSVVWEDGKAEERAIFETQLSDLGIKTGENGWEVVIAFDAHSTFNVESYRFLDNMGFTDSFATDASGYTSTDPMNAVRTILNDPQVIFSEDAMAMDGNGGGNFGDVAIKQLSEDGSYYQFISNDDGAYMIGNINFLDLGDFRGGVQAVLIKFQPEDVNGLFFTLFGNGEIILQFDNNQPYLVHVQDAHMAPYSDYMPTELTLQSDKWYWALMAMDSNGYYRSFVWEDGNAQEAAYCAENMGDWHPEYIGGNWHLTIGFGPNGTLNVMEYRILDFDGYADRDSSN